MRPDLHREYKHPKTGVVTKLTDLAKEFNLSLQCVSQRLKKRIPLTVSARPYRHKESKVAGLISSEPKKKTKKVKDFTVKKVVALGLNPLTGSLQNSHELAESLKISRTHARKMILIGKTEKIKVLTEAERMLKFSKKKAAREEMRKLIAEMDARKINIGHT